MYTHQPLLFFCIGDHILQEFNIKFLTRFRTYKIAAPLQTKMTSKDDIYIGLVSLKFPRPCEFPTCPTCCCTCPGHVRKEYDKLGLGDFLKGYSWIKHASWDQILTFILVLTMKMAQRKPPMTSSSRNEGLPRKERVFKKKVCSVIFLFTYFIWVKLRPFHTQMLECGVELALKATLRTCH